MSTPHRSSYGIQGHRSGHSSTLPLVMSTGALHRIHSRSEGMAYKCFWHPTLSRRRHECQLKCQLDGNNVTDGLHSSSSSLNRLSSGAHAHGLITSQTGSYTASRGSYTSIRGELTGQAGKLCFRFICGRCIRMLLAYVSPS